MNWIDLFLRKKKKKSCLLKQEQEMIKARVNEKCCLDCKTTQTPLWRSGPSGPKSLCNACGIRHRKKRAGAATANATSSVTLNKEEGKETTMKKKKRANISNGKCRKLSVEWRQRLVVLGEKVVLFQRRRPQLKKRQNFHKLGEVEQAAVLLMALSCGSVFIS